MKFRLVEDINLEEEVLNEKKWVEVSATHNGTPYGKPFYFYSTDGTNAVNDSDVQGLMPIITGKNKLGTYKQQLNKQILDRLKSDYTNCVNSGVTFGLSVTNHSVHPKKVKNHNCITLTDRDLRAVAHTAVGSVSVPTADDKMLDDNYYIHHKANGERVNSYKNLALIDKCHGLSYAHAVHKIIEKEPFPLIKSTKTVPIYEFDIATKQWKNTHNVTIDIT